MVLMTTVIILFGILIGLFGISKIKDKKTESGNILVTVAASLILVGLVGAGGYLAPLSGVPLAFDEEVTDEDRAPPGADLKPYTALTVGTHIWGSNEYATATGTFKIFEKGVNPSESNANPYDSITITSGVGNSSSGKLKSATDYVMVYDGSTTYYDQWYLGNAFPLTSQLPYIQTSESAISTANVDIRDILTIATISDPLNEAAVSGIINGQTSAANTTSGSSNELMIGTGVTAADDDVIYYNKTNGDGQFYIDITIAFDGADKKVKLPVLDIVNDLTTPFDGNEFSKVTLTRQSGTEYGAPKDITDYVNNADPIPLGTEAEGGDTGVYKILFNFDTTLMDATGDKLYIYVDDNGKHLGQDILKGTKATASDAITIGVRA